MRLHVLFDNEGTVIAAATLPTESGQLAPQARPNANESLGHSTALVEVPTEYRHWELREICERLTVAAEGERHVLRLKQE